MDQAAAVVEHKFSDFFSGHVRDGKILAKNPDCNVEERYPTAYNLGCGNKLWGGGWINVDGGFGADLVADLRELPIDTDSADAVAAIHVLEHFAEWESEDVLKEWRRILKPGGKMIIELPCLDKVFGYVAWCLKEREQMERFMTLYALYGKPSKGKEGMQHKYGYFQEELVNLLVKVGMREIQIMEPNYHFVMRDMRIVCVK